MAAIRTGTPPALRTEGLTKRYGTTVALDALDLVVEPGEVLGYLGPNGAGKSTTIGLLLGFLRPTAGRAEIFGLDVRARAPEVHRRLAYVPSVADLWPDLTGTETLDLLARLHGDVDAARRRTLLRRFEIAPDTRVRALSHGNRQKLPLVAAFASRADLLLLDEPTTGLDPLMEQAFRECVHEARADGRTVLLSSHILSEVEAVCTRVAMLRAGRLIDTGSLDVLRRVGDQRVHARLAAAVPDLTAVLTGVPGVSDVAVRDDVVDCAVRGPIQPLLEALTAVGVLDLQTREASLEELFLAHYGTG